MRTQKRTCARKKYRIEPLGFQYTGIWRLSKRHQGRCICADDMGLGKSMMAGHAAMPFRHKRPILVVCPNIAKWSWEEEVRKHFGMQSWILEGRTTPKRVPMFIPPFVIINWEILDAWANWIRKYLKPRVVIPDECHYAKNRKTLRTRALMRVCVNVPTIYPLSGTPIKNNPVEFYPILHLMWPHEFPAFRPFAMRYCKPQWNSYGIKYTGATHWKELNRRLQKLGYFRRLKSEVTDLPKVNRVVVPMKLKNMKEYKAAENNILGWLRKNKPGKAHKAKYNLGGVRMNYLLQITAEEKLPAVIEWIQNFIDSSNEKLCVFAHHRKFLQALHKKFKKQSVLVIGGIGNRKRKAAIDGFANRKKKQIFFGSIMAAGISINKLIVSSHIALAELVWCPSDIQQVIDRLNRLGQKKRVTAYFLVAKNTAEFYLASSVYAKQKVLNKVLEGRNPRKQEFDVLNKVFKKMRK